MKMKRDDYALPWRVRTSHTKGQYAVFCKDSEGRLGMCIAAEVPRWVAEAMVRGGEQSDGPPPIPVNMGRTMGDAITLALEGAR